MEINGRHLIRLPIEDTKANYLAGFWRWVELLAADDWEQAIAALYWTGPLKGTQAAAAGFKEDVTSFFGGPEPWSVVVPNERLVGEINAAAQWQLVRREDPFFASHQEIYKDLRGWFLALIPVTTRPANPKDDRIPLMGVAASFFLRPFDGAYVMQFEILHL